MGRAREGGSERIWRGDGEGRMSISSTEGWGWGWGGWRAAMSWLYEASVDIASVASCCVVGEGWTDMRKVGRDGA